MVIGINPLQTLSQVLVLTFRFTFDPELNKTLMLRSSQFPPPSNSPRSGHRVRRSIHHRGAPILAFYAANWMNLNPGFIWFERLASFERAQSSIANEFTIFHESSKQRGGGETEVTKRHQFHKITPTIDITNRIIIDVFTRRMSIILLFTRNLSIPKMGQISISFHQNCLIAHNSDLTDSHECI